MPQQAMFFDEGPGFVLVKPLGQGYYGSASLVLCVKDGKYYVRKEDLRPDGYVDVGKPNLEVRNACRAGHIEGTAKVQGWANYQNDRNRTKFTVSYWDYYTGGTLAELIDRSREARTTIPELWIAFWAAEMLDIVLGIHKVGIAHQDGHLNNWFLTSRGASGLPLIGLGDFGISRRRENCKDWLALCRKDFRFIYDNIDSLLDGRKHSELHHLVQKLQHYVHHAQSVKYLHEYMEIISQSAAAMLRNGCRRPLERQQELFEDGTPHGGSTVKLGFWPFNDPRYPRITNLKSFVVADVVDWATFQLKGQHSETYKRFKLVSEGGWTQIRGKRGIRIIR